MRQANANAVIFYNSAILSRLLTKCEASENIKALAFIAHISSAAWWHILLNGHYTFQSNGKMIDLDALVAGLELGLTEIWGLGSNGTKNERNLFTAEAD
jgi:hypothetical protein